MRNEIISLVAVGGKYAIEKTSLERFPKEAIKCSIDVGAEVLKEMLEMVEQNQPVRVPVLNDFLDLAQKCKLKRVERILIEVDGVLLPCYYMKGGDTARFCEMAGISQFPETVTEVICGKVEKAPWLYREALYKAENEER